MSDSQFKLVGSTISSYHASLVEGGYIAGHCLYCSSYCNCPRYHFWDKMYKKSVTYTCSIVADAVPIVQ